MALIGDILVIFLALFAASFAITAGIRAGKLLFRKLGRSAD